MRTLQTAEISKSYRGRKVVDNVSAVGEAGRSGGAAGPERRGQNHVVLHDRGADQPGFGPRAGEQDDGRRHHPLPMYQRARRGISYLPQEASVFRKLTVEDNLMAILQTLPLSRRSGASAWTG